MFLPSNITLSPGDSGDFVHELQRRLSSIHLFPAEALSGVYDGMTTSAVTSFQFQQGLRSDGIAGPETLRRLNGVLSGTASSSPATTPAEDAKTEEEMRKAFYVIDDAAQATQQPDAFTFQQPQPVMDPFAVAVAEQKPALSPAQQTAPVQPAPELQKPIDPFIVAPQQPMTPPLANIARAPQPQQPIDPFIVAPEQKPLTPPQPDPRDIAQQKPVPEQQTAQPAKPAVDPFAVPQPEQKPQQPQQTKPAIDPFAVPQPEQKPQQPQQAKPAIDPFAVPQPEQNPQLQPAQNPRDIAQQKPLPEQQKPAAAASQGEAAEAGQERPTLRQRFSGMMQRVAEYMESKLSPSVMSEVQKIGQQLNERGVRELPIPQNETALPSPSPTPGRGPAQTAER